jgi:hypothetical protein
MKVAISQITALAVGFSFVILGHLTGQWIVFNVGLLMLCIVYSLALLTWLANANTQTVPVASKR